MTGAAGGARAVAVEALMRIEDGAYANLVLPGLLARSQLSERDRAFATDLVYGTTRMRRACDWLVDRFVLRTLDPAVRVVLRLGAYQLVFLGTPAHAAVSATVDCAPARTGGLVNAVLRRVATAGVPPEWPDLATRLSYPDWIVARLQAELGTEPAIAALEAMNLPAAATTRADGYVQDLASQWVAAFVGARPGERVADVCAGPGGKTTAMAEENPAIVVGLDRSDTRAGLVAANASKLSLANVGVVVGDGRRPPLRPGSFDRVLVDAPCSGLGVLRRRPDARWRIESHDVEALAAMQRSLLEGALGLARAGGTVVYSVCTLTRAETVDIDAWMAEAHPGWDALDPPADRWEPAGRGARLLPQAAGTDGMFLVSYRSPAAS